MIRWLEEGLAFLAILIAVVVIVLLVFPWELVLLAWAIFSGS